MKPIALARSTLAALLLATMLLPGLRADEVKIKIPLPPAPRIVLPAPPPMIWLPQLRVYVAHDTPHSIFFHDGHYYLFHQNVWYLGPGYAGPWTVINVRQVPPGLHTFRGERWEEYERDADRRYRNWHDDDAHYPFYARREAHERHERAYWHERREDRGDHDRGRRDERGDRRDHDQGRSEHRGRGRDDD